MLTEVGPVGLEVPRDRNSTFGPRPVPKRSRRLRGGLDKMIISLYAGGMTVRDISHHRHRTLGLPDHPREGALRAVTSPRSINRF